MLAKTKDFERRLGRIADLAKALSHPARLAILELLATREQCICGEVVEELPLAQATVSRHLKALKEAGLIKGEIDGPRSCYCLDHEAVQEMGAQFETFFSTFPASPESSECC